MSFATSPMDGVFNYLDSRPGLISTILFLSHCLLTTYARTYQYPKRHLFASFLLNIFASTSGATLTALMTGNYPKWILNDTVVLIPILAWFLITLTPFDIVRKALAIPFLALPLQLFQATIGFTTILNALHLSLATFAPDYDWFSRKVPIFITLLVCVVGGTGGLWFNALEGKLTSRRYIHKNSPPAISPLSAPNRWISVAFWTTIILISALLFPHIWTLDGVLVILTRYFYFPQSSHSQITSLMTFDLKNSLFARFFALFVPVITKSGGVVVHPSFFTAQIVAGTYYIISHFTAIIFKRSDFHLLSFVQNLFRKIFNFPSSFHITFDLPEESGEHTTASKQSGSSKKFKVNKTSSSAKKSNKVLSSLSKSKKSPKQKPRTPSKPGNDSSSSRPQPKPKSDQPPSTDVGSDSATKSSSAKAKLSSFFSKPKTTT